MTHTMSWKLPLLAIAGLFLSTMTASAQTGTFIGMVKGPDGKPLKDAIVKIERQDIRGNYKTKSNKKGEFIHAGLPLGTYNLTVEVGGKSVDSVNGVRTRLGEPVEINFDLEALAKKQEAFNKAQETGTITKEQARDMTPEQKAAMEKAIKEREKQMAKNKELNDAFNAGMEAMQARDYPTAAENLTRAAEMDPKQPVIWAQLADARASMAGLKTGDEQTQLYNQAFEAFNQAIELKPEDSGYRNNYGLALAKAKRFDEAQEQLTKAAEIEPTKAGMYFYNLGALLVNNQQLEPAGAAFKKAIEADPEHADSHYQLGIYLSSKMQADASGKMVPPEGMREAFQKYLDLKPTGPFAESAKGMIAMLDTQIDTEYQNPDAKKKGKAKKKK
ncbi:MAG: tetratricopeptide repeat protein [Bryobacterales bacterium]|nr:tetratricopeptide repeat protein [Bryobacterales bacterium]